MSEIGEIKNQLTILKNGQTRILSYLESDDKTKKKGLVEDAQIIKDRVSVLETRDKIEKAKAGIFGGIIGGTMAVIVVIIKEYITRKT